MYHYKIDTAFDMYNTGETIILDHFTSYEDAKQVWDEVYSTEKGARFFCVKYDDDGNIVEEHDLMEEFKFV